MENCLEQRIARESCLEKERELSGDLQKKQIKEKESTTESRQESCLEQSLGHQLKPTIRLQVVCFTTPSTPS